MKRIALAASITLALATTAFAQDNTAPVDPAAAADSQPATSDDSQADSQQSMPAPMHHHNHRMTQQSNQVKHYPAVDRGHVPGDPPVIDHNSDQTPVANPTHTTISVPPIR